MKRAIARDQQQALSDAIERVGRPRLTIALILSSSIIAGIRLARDHNITTGSPRVMSVVSDSISLARRIILSVLRGDIS
jgi:hypothetical protein